jgi:L-ascorbate metabolism protein UlaG (beta-lactamase superfamily)
MPRGVLLALLTLGITACAVLEHRQAYHEGPASAHFDGVRFHNPDGRIGKGLWQVVRWRLTADSAPWPESVPLTANARPPERVHGAALNVTFVGHATVLLQTAGLNILTDPHWSERAFPVQWAGPRRVTPPGVAFEDLPPIDLVVVSHSHYDHMDLPTLARLQREHAPLFVLPLGNDAIVRPAADGMRIATLDWWESTTVDDDVRVHAVPVYHWSRRGPFDRNKALWAGFVIETPGGAVYFAGDTGIGSGEFFRQAAQRFGGFRLALIPVGSYEPRWFMQDQHVNPDEAVQMHQWLRAHTSLGIHLRTFRLTDEAYEQPDLELQAAVRERQIPPERFFTLAAGQGWSEPATTPLLHNGGGS